MNTDLATTVNGEVINYPIDHDAVLKAVGLNARDPKAQALLLVCERYGLDPILKHVVLIGPNTYVTRDGLLTVAHRSGKLDGIVVLEQSETPTHHVAKVAVHRKDMGHPFTYVGRYPKSGHLKQYGPEMAVKCAEVMALRRAFNVALCAREELWEQDHHPQAVEARVVEPTPAPEPPPARAKRPGFRQWVSSAAQRMGVNEFQLVNHFWKWAHGNGWLDGHDANPGAVKHGDKLGLLGDLFQIDDSNFRAEARRYDAEVRAKAERAEVGDALGIEATDEQVDPPGPDEDDVMDTIADDLETTEAGVRG
jgi:hypothetical protein